MKKVCLVCQTTSFRRSADSGLVCKYGHKVLGIQQEQGDEDTVGYGVRKKVKKLQENTALTPAQHKSYEIQIMQFALQVMARTLLEDFGFPPEFETTLREFWILYLSESKYEMAEAYRFEAEEKKPRFNSCQEEDMEGLDLFSDPEASEEEDLTEESKEKSHFPGAHWPVLNYSHTLAFIYITCIYLRYPVLPNDILTWCKTTKLPYLTISSRIPKDILGSMKLYRLERMNRLPTLYRLKWSSYRIAHVFHIKCGLEIPNYNVPLYLDRFCSYYFLPGNSLFITFLKAQPLLVEGYLIATHIYEQLLQLGSQGLLHIPRFNLGQHKEYKHPSIPSIALACVIATAKILYSVDGSEADLEKASPFNKYLSKEEWLKKIHVNKKLWASRIESTETVDFMIDLLKERSTADVISIEPKRQLGALASMVSSREPEETKERPHILGPFMQPPEVLDATLDRKKRQLFDEPLFYYYRKDGFRPKDYTSLLKLASYIDGDIYQVEEAMKLVDDVVTRLFCDETFKYTKASQKLYEERYGLATTKEQ
ncbi:hypothetical protein BY458DRAFT_492539 [Sporodiniella umbellata]|nr:hypothetical protein BY458DRAFT_492539 [Sporodiniella umbellata]